MAIFNRFPFSNAHELNLDWIIRQLKDLLRRVKHLEETEGGGGGDPGTTNYNDLSNKPKINNVTLQGNKTSIELNIPTTTTIRAEINHAFQLYDPAEADYAPPYAVGTLGYAIENAAIDPEDVQDAIDVYLDDHPTITGTFTNAAKNALLDLLEKVAYIDGNGQTYLDTLRTELFSAAVTSISAVFTQGAAVIYDTDNLNTLKQYLVVTANYSDGTSETVSNYTLSGSLTVGTSTVTVEYGQQTDTISVVVSNGFLYTPENGLLSLQSYVDSGSTDITDIFTESITGGFYRLACAALSGSGTVAKKIVFTKRYNTKCIIKLDFKVNDVPYLSNTNTTTPGVLFICGSNMDEDEVTFNGLCLGIARKGSATGDVYLKIGTGSGATWNTSHFATGGVHNITATMENGAQTIQLDGVTVLSSLSPYTATAYGTETFLRLMQGGSNPTNVDIQRLEMYFE